MPAGLCQARAKREKQNKNLKFSIRFFVYRHLFSFVFQQTKRPKNLQMFLVKIKNIFVEKNIFSLIFLFRHQFFLCYKTFNLNTWRNELNLQKQTKNEHVMCLRGIPDFLIFILRLLINTLLPLISPPPPIPRNLFNLEALKGATIRG